MAPTWGHHISAARTAYGYGTALGVRGRASRLYVRRAQNARGAPDAEIEMSTPMIITVQTWSNEREASDCDGAKCDGHGTR
eukprot:7221826-Prymnesium_polylepis.1